MASVHKVSPEMLLDFFFLIFLSEKHCGSVMLLGMEIFIQICFINNWRYNTMSAHIQPRKYKLKKWKVRQITAILKYIQTKTLNLKSEIWPRQFYPYTHQSFFAMQLCKLKSPWEQLRHNQMSVIQPLKEIKHCRCAFVFAKFGGSTQCWEMRHSVLLLLLLHAGAKVQNLLATKRK